MSEEIVDLSRSGAGDLGDGGGEESFDFPELETGGGDEPHGLTAEPIDVREFGEEPEGEGGGEWYDDLPDDLRQKVMEKGYRSIEDLARGYVGAESQVGKFSSEIGELRDAVANLASSRGGDEPRHTAEPQNPVPTMGQVAAFSEDIAKEIDEGRMDVGDGIRRLMAATAGVSEAREAHLLERFEALMAERTEPLEQFRHSTSVGREITSLRSQLGEELYRELEPQAKALIRQWENTQPGFLQNPRAVRTAFAEARLLQDAQQRKERGSAVLTSTARGGRSRGRSAAQTIVDEMDALNPGGYGGGL